MFARGARGLSMKIVTLLAAEGVAVDVFTGRVSAYNIIDRVFAPSTPARLPRLHLLVQFERGADEQPETVFHKIELLAPTGDDVLQAPLQESTVTDRTHTSVHHAWNVKLPRAGDYVLKLSGAKTAEGPWAELCARVIPVVETPHPLMPAPAAPST